MSSSPIPIRPEAGDEVDPATDRILEVALTVFEDVGFRKATIEDIARRAGVERITVYRRIGSKNDIVNAVTVRESQRVLRQILEEIASVDALEDRVVIAFTGLVLGLRDHALFSRLMHLEPVSTLPRVTTEASPALVGAIHAAVAALGPEAVALAGSLDAVVARVEIIARTVHSIVMTPDGAVDLKTPEQLREFARKFVVPIIMAGPVA